MSLLLDSNFMQSRAKGSELVAIRFFVIDPIIYLVSQEECWVLGWLLLDLCIFEVVAVCKLKNILMQELWLWSNKIQSSVPISFKCLKIFLNQTFILIQIFEANFNRGFQNEGKRVKIIFNYLITSFHWSLYQLQAHAGLDVIEHQMVIRWVSRF